MSTTTFEAALAAKGEALRRLSHLADVVSVGITRDEAGYSLKVNLSDSSRLDEAPAQVDGIPVHVEVVKCVRAGAAVSGRRGK